MSDFANAMKAAEAAEIRLRYLVQEFSRLRRFDLRRFERANEQYRLARLEMCAAAVREASSWPNLARDFIRKKRVS